MCPLIGFEGCACTGLSCISGICFGVALIEGIFCTTIKVAKGIRPLPIYAVIAVFTAFYRIQRNAGGCSAISGWRFRYRRFVTPIGSNRYSGTGRSKRFRFCCCLALIKSIPVIRLKTCEYRACLPSYTVVTILISCLFQKHYR